MCSTSWCDQKPRTKGMCAACYAQWYKGNDPERVRRRKVHHDATNDERLRFHGWTVTESGCWEWGGRRDDKGYGVLATKKNKQAFAHRIAFDTWIEGVNPDLSVCHSCDNPPCINPSHLWQGTEGDNKDDMARKGRGNTVRLTPPVVQELRRKYPVPLARGLVPKLARQYGISESAMRAVLNRKTWKNV